MRYRIDLAYDGTDFFGWQIQPKVRTVQEEVEKALGVLLKETVGVVGAGRTDTGVSATFYVAHFDCSDAGVDCAQLRYKLNAILPKSVCIINVAPAAPDFHARFDARLRQYCYYLHRVKDPFLEGRSYYFAYPEVDFEKMNEAASRLVGTHDFSCFEKSGGDNKTSICTVYRAFWEPCEPLVRAGIPLIMPAPVPGPSGMALPGYEVSYWRFVIEADRFLRNMVRAIVGTLLEVGRGRRYLHDFDALILPPDASDGLRESRRSLAGESAPAHALYLTDIRF